MKAGYGIQCSHGILGARGFKVIWYETVFVHCYRNQAQLLLSGECLEYRIGEGFGKDSVSRFAKR
jgi:hypothetical protein